MKLLDITQKQAAKRLRILYLIWALVGMFSIMYVNSKLIVWNDAATTASNITNNQLLFNAGILGSLITQLLFIIVVLHLHKLFSKVNKDHARLMVIFALVSVPIAMFNEIFKIAASLVLKTPGTEQLALIFLELNAQGIIIASIFWGLWLFPLGYLAYKSNYFPKFVGIALIIGGFGYFIESLLLLLLPNFYALNILFEIMIFGEMVFILWLIIRGAKIK